MISFKLFGVEVHIKFMFVAMVTIFLLVDKTGISVIALLACLIHELGHVVMFYLVGYKPISLSFDLTGICLTKPTAQLSYVKEVLVQLAGSTTNFIVFALLCGTISEVSYSSIFATTHLIICIFNLLPLKSFDGGKLLEITLLRIMSIKTTVRVCTFIDLACIFILLTASVCSFFFAQHSFTLIVLTVYLMITALIKLNQD